MCSDDHDYGWNNAGAEYAGKAGVKPLLMEFLGEPPTSVRGTREGAYVSYGFGAGDTRVLLILLDVRYFRAKTPVYETRGDGQQVVRGHDDDMLGAAQWAWLAEQLRDPAPVKLLGSGIQVHADTPVVESWRGYPQSRARLLNLIAAERARGVVALSGDVHFAEMSCCTDRACAAPGYPLLEFTSSGMTHVVCVARGQAGLSKAALAWGCMPLLNASPAR
jgi:alkaline phosphatase D